MKIPMKLTTLTLLIATLIAVSGTFSPIPESTGDQTLDIDAGKTRVSVSSDEDELSIATAAVVGVADDVAGNTRVSVSSEVDQLSTATAAVVGVAEDVAGKAKEVLSNVKGRFSAPPRELSCDSVGKCKHRIARVLSKAKERAMKAEEKVKELALEVTSKIEECTEGVRRNAQENTKRGKGLIWDGFGHMFLPKSVDSLMSMIQITGFAMAYGTSMWVTFEMSHIVPRILPKQQFGMVQCKIYPLYFKAMVGSIGLALVGHLTRQRANLFKNKAEMIQAFNLMVLMLSVLVNLKFLEPRATKVRFERLKLEKDEGKASKTERGTTDEPALETNPSETVPLEDRSVYEVDWRLRQVNWLSALLNVVTLMGLNWHLMYLGNCLALNL